MPSCSLLLALRFADVGAINSRGERIAMRDQLEVVMTVKQCL